MPQQQDELRDTVLLIGWRLDQIDKWIDKQDISTEDIRIEQAEIRVEQKAIMRELEGSIIDNIGNLFSKLFQAKSMGYIAVAGLIVWLLIIELFGEGVIGIINAFQGAP